MRKGEGGRKRGRVREKTMRDRAKVREDDKENEKGEVKLKGR